MPNYQQVISADTLIHTGKGILFGLVVSANSSSSAPRLVCYDNTSGSGTVIFDAYIALRSVAQPAQFFFPERFAPRFNTGLYLDVTDCTVIVWADGA
jgi:hypothetical protein